MMEFANIQGKFKEIETAFAVEKINYKGVYLWPFLRVILYFMCINEGEEKKYAKNNIFYKILYKVKFYFKIYHALLHSKLSLFFIKKPVILIQDDGEYRKLDKSIVKQHTQDIEELLSNKVHIQQNTKYGGKKYTKDSIDDLVIMFMCKLLSIAPKYRISKYDIAHCEILDQILVNMSLTFDYVKTVRLYLAAIDFYSSWFKKVQPRAFVFGCYYDLKMAGIYAAKQLNIPTIEFQHGVATKSSVVYYCYKKIPSNPYPEYFLAFGDNYKNEIIDGNIFEPNKIVCVGYYYMSLIKTYKKEIFGLFHTRFCKYNVYNRLVVVVPSQIYIDQELFDFSYKLAQLEKNIFVIFVPRTPKKKYHVNNTIDNFCVENVLDIYQLMLNAHVTIGCWTACMVESLYLGTPSIIVDINGISKNIYGEMLENIKSVIFTSTLTETIDAIKRIVKIDRRFVYEEGKRFYADSHKQRIEDFFNKLGLISKFES